MSVTERRPAVRPRWVLERRWDHATRPLPRRWVLPDGTAARTASVPPETTPLDFTARMRRLCDDVAARCPELGHIDTSAVLFTFTPAATAAPTASRPASPRCGSATAP